MKASIRIFVNTIAQYVKTLLNVGLTLISTRLILKYLGVEDFGIYSLIAGVVSMLAFAINAMSSTTQRFMSFHQGKSSLDDQKKIFSNCLYIHLFLGIAFFLVLISLMWFIFDGYLNISNERIYAAKLCFCFIAFMLFISFITSPFRAVLISHENILYLSIIDVIDGVLKVIFAILLGFSQSDRLILYCLFLCLIQLFNLIAISIYAFSHYTECKSPTIKVVNKKHIYDILGFASWNIYSVACIIGRTQGLAVIINRFFGPLMNAAYGLSFQISGYINFMSESLLNAVRPQIIKSEGLGNREHSIWLSTITCKYSFFLLSLIAIPTIFEIPKLLDIWLENVPDFTIVFCRMVLIASVIDSLTIGLSIVNQAVGNVKKYALCVNTVKLLTLPTVYLFEVQGYNIFYIVICYIIFEFICAMARIEFISKTVGMDKILFVKNVFFKEIIPFILLVLCSFLINRTVSNDYRFILTFFISDIVFVFSIYLFSMTEKEKNLLLDIYHKIHK